MKRVSQGAKRSQAELKPCHVIIDLMLHAGKLNYRWEYAEKLCALFIANMMHSYGYAFPSIEYISSHLDISERWVRKCLQVLCEGPADGRNLPIIFIRQPSQKHGKPGKRPVYEYYPSNFILAELKKRTQARKEGIPDALAEML